MEQRELAAHLTTWITTQVSKAKMQGIILGLSGGIDSAVVAALAKRACGDNVLGLILPCHSQIEDASDAQLVADVLGLKTITVDLGDTFDALLQATTSLQHSTNRRLAEANIKPRLRMTTLYYYAQQLHYLVAGTSNRSELTIGYSTKFGDGGCDLLPIAHLVKWQVNKLAVELGIPEKIITKAPSAGLWDGQTDEQEMGFTYGQLDHYILTGQGPEGLVKRINAMKNASEHKRQLPPIPQT